VKRVARSAALAVTLAATGPVMAAAPALAALAAVAALPACAKQMPRTELRLRVVPADGAAVASEEDTRITAGVIDLVIGELGIKRREVLPLPKGFVRVVLPESQKARMPDVRKRLEDPKLRVKIE